MGSTQKTFGIHISDFCGSIFPSSKQGDIDIAQFEVPRRRTKIDHEANWWGRICTKVRNWETLGFLKGKRS